MSVKSSLHSLAVLLLVLVGVAPFLYFVSVEIEIAQASTEPADSAAIITGHDRFVENLSFGVGEREAHLGSRDLPTSLFVGAEQIPPIGVARENDGVGCPF